MKFYERPLYELAEIVISKDILRRGCYSVINGEYSDGIPVCKQRDRSGKGGLFANMANTQGYGIL